MSHFQITSEERTTDNGLSVRAEKGVLHLRLNRPDRLNAFTADMANDMREALAEARDQPSIGAVMFSGAGKAFSAGIDLEKANMSEKPGWFAKEMREVFHTLMQEMVSYPKPIVCAVQGVCAGGALGFVTSSDIVLCSETARFIPAFVKVGLVPDCGTTWVLPRRIGRARAEAWALLGDDIDGVTAAAWGLVWRATPQEKLQSEAIQTAERLANGPRVAIQQIRSLFNASENSSFSSALDAEVEAQVTALASPDAAEGRRAFLEGRPAKFGVSNEPRKAKRNDRHE
ncbi:enoyl-CoA hydratase-related protein [uncultured Sneathiella sp.]|uniref:enoyl-CoA hydratase/isomerase family protein n=1 Tax=uncultured Sneathiella sp. TaxID=879315 RepID=UPI0030EBD2E2|tara:strand:- start:34691 stop:35548 length:858 start_codon:yes stop_codon:yes gene_type:complete